ncbi:DUF4365 domain-containing protein [Actinomadura violacea]|uniref:DUF4365 domain-containing protein n=1 Tax=Actinomadura violacea TaxID=2819934 RepID=A0ABS3RN45_9ACTN|nr:DUF4365 domain-containing protein [Actinomadura violacea]MBO2458126.1 DUF4365 domain-containing protein [Actinomadura violacea]
MSDEARRGGREEASGAWQFGLPLSEMKQQVSLAYVHMVAAAAGCWLKPHTTDYDGVDITVASSEDHELFFGPQFELQLKCTSQRNVVRDDHIAWSMEGKPYRKLTNPKRYLPAFLGILVVPEDPSLWLEQDEQSLLSRSALYWQSAAALETIGEDAQSKTVRVPRSNLFDVPQLLGIMKTLGEGGDW